MFDQSQNIIPSVVDTPKLKNIISIYNSSNTIDTETNYNMMDQFLENEKQKNKTESWIKLDKTLKVQKLHQFAEKYGKDNSLPVKDIKTLKMFFTDCLEKNRLNKTKDVTYNKESCDVVAIPALHFNQTNRSFTLKITDPKRVSTLKSLTPKRSENSGNSGNLRFPEPFPSTEQI
jgi:hypothetical protein